MIMFDVSLNGKRVALAGAKDLEVLTTHVTATGKLGPATMTPRGSVYDLYLSVTGLTGRKRGPDEHLRWFPLRPLEVGDEILVRITEGATAQQPASRESARQFSRTFERQRFESAKAAYFGLRRKYEGKGAPRRSTKRPRKRASAPAR
ncbi:MAG: hypothetical protein AB1486_00655 [Planctomycetota bacterium]